MAKRKILYFVVGVGAGNTTRTLAILDELHRQAPYAKVELAVQGNALQLLRQRFQVHEMHSVTYSRGNGGLVPWRIITQNLSFPRRFRENQWRAGELMDQIQPDVVVSDSDFYCLAPAKRRRLPLITVNSSPATVQLFRRYGVPRECLFSGHVVERIDAFLQKRYPHRVVAPVIRPLRDLARNVHQVPVIVRPELQAARWEPEDQVVVVTGGSGIGTADIDLRGIKAPLVTYGTKLEKVPPHADQRGFDLSAFEAMRRAKVLVIQGGFSSVSEALAIGAPTVVLPIAGHAEQRVNGLELESLGRGLSVRGPSAAGAVAEVLRRFDEIADRGRENPIRCDGARLAAREISSSILSS
jgi:uncharacterized protein (TIGR00661 family)